MEKDFQKGEIVIYTSEDGTISLDTKLEDETIWLTQDMMAKLFETTVPNINMHMMKKSLNKIELLRIS